LGAGTDKKEDKPHCGQKNLPESTPEKVETVGTLLRDVKTEKRKKKKKTKKTTPQTGKAVFAKDGRLSSKGKRLPKQFSGVSREKTRKQHGGTSGGDVNNGQMENGKRWAKSNKSQSGARIARTDKKWRQSVPCRLKKKGKVPGEAQRMWETIQKQGFGGTKGGGVVVTGFLPKVKASKKNKVRNQNKKTEAGQKLRARGGKKKE